MIPQSSTTSSTPEAAGTGDSAGKPAAPVVTSVGSESFNGAANSGGVNTGDLRKRRGQRALPATQPHASAIADAVDPHPAIEVLGNLLGETAHDLRSPLTTIRESVRLVRDGDVGPVSSEQSEFLSAAMDQCDCIAKMVDDMIHFDSLQTSMPPAHRRWVSVAEIRDAVEDTLRPWSVPRGISLLWDGIGDVPKNVYADAGVVRRILVNLVVNAIQVTPEGGNVLVRLTPTRGGETLRWSVVDEGPGIPDASLQGIVKRSVSGTGSSGLGLTICQKLASLCFSALDIRSRAGSGTEMSFETPAGTPANLAESWSRWRVGFRNPAQSPKHRRTREVLGKGQAATHEIDKLIRRSRLDPPSLSTQLAHTAMEPDVADRFVTGSVTLGAALPKAVTEPFERLLQSHAKHFDLFYRIDQRSWVWILDANVRDVRRRIAEIHSAAENQFDAFRARWSEPQTILINGRGTSARVCDLFVRETLHASSKEKVIDRDQVRLGTGPLAPSDVATNRLDEELQRLGRRLRQQTELLKNQAVNLRPDR